MNLAGQIDIAERLADYFTRGEGVGKAVTSEELRRKFNVSNRGTVTRGIRKLREWGFEVEQTRADGQVLYYVKWPQHEPRHWRTARADYDKAVAAAKQTQ